MSRKLQELFEEASALPEHDRATLADLLLESLGDERDEGVEQAWEEEIERRIRAVDAGEMATIPWEEVQAELHARRHEKD
jgi:putative addiction module component (TIGR02574 family)